MSMKEINVIGLDLAKNVFQVHGVNGGVHVRASLALACLWRFILPVFTPSSEYDGSWNCPGEPGFLVNVICCRWINASPSFHG